MVRLLALALCALLVAGCGSASGSSRPVPTDTVEAQGATGEDTRRVEAMLRGQIAGVRVENTPRGLAVRVRGTSMSSNEAPLFVVNGLPLAVGDDGVLDGINPRDVASIRVLKNASDTAMYGSRGANGVVLITMKKGDGSAR